MTNTLTNVSYTIVKETEKAVNVDFGIYASKTTKAGSVKFETRTINTWIPKSQLNGDKDITWIFYKKLEEYITFSGSRKPWNLLTVNGLPETKVIKNSNFKLQVDKLTSKVKDIFNNSKYYQHLNFTEHSNSPINYPVGVLYACMGWMFNEPNIGKIHSGCKRFFPGGLRLNNPLPLERYNASTTPRDQRKNSLVNEIMDSGEADQLNVIVTYDPKRITVGLHVVKNKTHLDVEPLQKEMFEKNLDFCKNLEDDVIVPPMYKKFLETDTPFAYWVERAYSIGMVEPVELGSTLPNGTKEDYNIIGLATFKFTDFVTKTTNKITILK